MKRTFEAGEKFSRLTVLSRTSQTAICACDCGNTKTVHTSNLLRGATKSCGCLNKSLDHGLTNSITYQSWRSMKRRCLNPANSNYSNYGDRGIKIYLPWVRSFLQFLNDVGERPAVKYSLERINNSGNYEPGNVKWATRIEQGLNKRSNRLLNYRGQTLPASEWARRMNIPVQTLFGRIYSGWGVDRALTVPIKSRSSNKAQGSVTPAI